MLTFAEYVNIISNIVVLFPEIFQLEESMEDIILIKEMDLDLRIEYVYVITREQGRKMVNANIDEIVSLGKDGDWI